MYKDYWNETHEKYFKGEIKYDRWLEEYNNLIKETTKPIIDLGCGEGNNTKYLIEHDKKVVACDYSEKALEIVKTSFPDVEVLNFDMSHGLPFQSDYTDLVIADLSLHYFDTETTIKVLSEIKRILTTDGHLLFRVNSIKDDNFGANGGVKIENNYYHTDGYDKRFFDEEDILKFFNMFEIINYEEDYMERYGPKKILWKGIVKKS